ncbi:hydantoinase/oxoprolinase family protein [Mesorhizobium sp. M0520]|uniref:hydantoinase/oxoprolinase family protein n=1 Tax=Mesorhizobium sp. M0520 TaxID=2956957 RepID=UPI00333603D7
MLVAPFRVGVDVGGTFTDLVIVDAQGKVLAFKTPSVPADPAQGVLNVATIAATALGRDIEAFLSDVGLFVHGSTVATNTLLEQKGAKVGLLTTQGFRDTLEIRRAIRDNVWDHRRPYPPVLVPRYLRLPVLERMDVHGNVVQPIDEKSLERALASFEEEGVESIAVAFLHSYKNPAHEQAARNIIKSRLPEVWVTLSSEVAPIIGEYERASTAVVNAFVAPRVVPYLEKLDVRLSELGLPGKLLMIQSNGGAISVPEIAVAPVRLVLSGPAAGVGSLKFYGADAGSDNLLSIEVGGTSCDVTLMQRNTVSMTDQLNIDGYHIAIPAVDINTVGAGGGTIASVDSAGMLVAGPEGAGSTPGPACYGRGGQRPTVTDAQLVLGRLKPGPYAQGAIVLDLAKAEEAIRRHVADPLALSVHAAAAGIIQLVEQNILHAVEQASLERGINPRNFTLVAAGGAGPLHGSATARLLGCSNLYIPRLAGVFCAFGMCNSDLRLDVSSTWLQDLDDARATGTVALDERFGVLREQVARQLAREGFTPDSVRFIRSYDLRYFGQQWTIAVLTEVSEPGEIRRAFEENYRQQFGFIQDGGQIEVVNLRLAAIGENPPLQIARTEGRRSRPEPIGRRPVWVDPQVGLTEIPIYDGTGLAPGQELAGPAVIEEATTTVFVGAGETAKITEAGNYLLRITESGSGHQVWAGNHSQMVDA